MSEFQDVQKKKSHRERLSGRKAERKKNKRQKIDQDLTDKQRNPKAFTFNSAVKAERRFRHKQDIETKKQHVPLVDRSSLEPPPILVGVVGPPKVGKSTLIHSLIKFFTKTSLVDVKGPVTLVTGKKRRITLIECNNDINSMIDLAKVADLILIMCDASFGFEMEVFEFLNICQVHGMPRIMGILTHLDTIKNSKALKNTKKTLKHRFWTEVYAGAKLFYLSGILHGEYLYNEIKNLGRFVSVMKLRPLTWRTTHSYLLGDRYEDLTNQELIRKNPKCSRNVSLYGYVRGIPLSKQCSVHIAGVGDLPIEDISYLPDPCPLPEAIKKRALVEKERLVYAPFSGVGGIIYDKDAVYIELGGSHSHKRQSDDLLNNIIGDLINTEKTLDIKMEHSSLQLFRSGEKLMAKDVEGNEDSLKSNLVNDTRLHLKNKNNRETELEKELNKLRNNLANGHFDQEDEEFNKLSSSNDEESSTCSDDDDDQQNNKQSSRPLLSTKQGKSELHTKVTDILKELQSNELKRKVHLIEQPENDKSKKLKCDDSNELDEIATEGEDEEPSDAESEGKSSEDNFDVKWKENLAEKAFMRHNKSQNIMKTVYGVFENQSNHIEPKQQNNTVDEIGGLFRVAHYERQKQKLNNVNTNVEESSLHESWSQICKDWLDPENKTLIQNCFVTGTWRNTEDAAELLKLDDAETMGSDDSEVYDDFEDLETGEKYTSVKKDKESKDTEKRLEHEIENDLDEKKSLAEKKSKLKEKFDAEYDNSDKSYYNELKSNMEKQSQLNKTIFENLPDDLRVQIEGYRPGMYVRIQFQNVPAEFVENFDPTYPLVIGALNMSEENIGFVNVKIKKHRWYKRILKTNDPLIVSLGWRRFQTVPIYSKLEDDLKFRYLKYTPEHVTCNAHFWGPVTPQGTGFVAFQSCEEDSAFVKQNFRIAATGAVQELDKSTKIMKKLKLIGHPLKIYKKTAFIKGMFNSSLEVAKFEGAQIKTVSGIRGQIKKATSKPEGSFRATFEDKIQLSDIVFCRTWFKVNVSQFYNPVITLLLPKDKKNNWRGARTLGQIKREENIQNKPNKDSLFKEIIRNPKVFKSLAIPRKLQQTLPYRDKPKFKAISNKKEKTDTSTRIAVIREPHERKVSNMMKMLQTTFKYKQDQMKVTMIENKAKYKQEIENAESHKTKKVQLQKKQVMRAKSKMQLSKEKNKSKSK